MNLDELEPGEVYWLLPNGKWKDLADQTPIEVELVELNDPVYAFLYPDEPDARDVIVRVLGGKVKWYCSPDLLEKSCDGCGRPEGFWHFKMPRPQH